MATEFISGCEGDSLQNAFPSGSGRGGTFVTVKAELIVNFVQSFTASG